MPVDITPTNDPKAKIVNTVVDGSLWQEACDAYKGPHLSKRALRECPTHALTEGLDNIFRRSYDAESNPDGIINLGIAENSLLTKEYIEYYGDKFKENLTAVDLTYGNQASGSSRLHRAIAKMWNDNFDPVQPVRPDDIVTGPGATSVLDMLIRQLADVGEGVMIATPYYTGFDVNMVARSGARIVQVILDDSDESMSPKSLDAFEAALEKAKDDGITVRAVMLCNPQNPIGRTYDRETLLAYGLFCEKHDLHLIADEIYALSVFGNPNLPNAPPFMSYLSLDVEKETGKPFNNSRVHIVYSFSKDFGVNGFRVGCVISPFNRLVLRSILHTAFLMKVSSPADVLISGLLNDDTAFKHFVKLNQDRLADSAAHVRAWFEKRGCIPRQSNASHFMLVDARQRLGIKTWDDEREINLKAAAKGVVIGLGRHYHYPIPGYLRVTFSVERSVLDLGLERFEEALGLHPIE